MPDTPKDPIRRITTPDDTQTKVTQSKDGAVQVSHPHAKHHGISALLEPDDLVREQVGGFADFLREYAVVALAIGFIVGQQANAVVKQLVDSFIKPGVEVLFGDDLSKRTATFHHGAEKVPMPWGAFLYTAIEFLFVVVAIYVMFKLFRLDKLKKVEKGKKGKK